MYPNRQVIATIHALRSGQSASAQMSDEEELIFREDITQLCKEILEKDFESIRPQAVPHCPYCDFLPRCQNYWNRIVKREFEENE